eukprot:1156818-Pelagomonas_calceolata.AAC.11
MPRTCPAFPSAAAFPSQPLCSTPLHSSNNRGTSKQGNRWKGMGACCTGEGSSIRSNEFV